MINGDKTRPRVMVGVLRAKILIVDSLQIDIIMHDRANSTALALLFRRCPVRARFLSGSFFPDFFEL